MEILGNLIRLKPEYEERYIILHRHTFPGVLAQIRKSNIVNYSIFLHRGILFSYSEYIGTDYASDMNSMAADPTTREWWKLTDPMQEPLQPSNAGEWWKKAELVFRLDETAKAPAETARYAFVGAMQEGGHTAIGRIDDAVGPSLVSCFRRAHVQDYRVFLSGRSVYVYLEYWGDDFARDHQQLGAEPAWRKFHDGLLGSLQGPWESMTEVFHTL